MITSYYRQQTPSSCVFTRRPTHGNLPKPRHNSLPTRASHKTEIVVVGGGTGGIAVAHQLHRQLSQQHSISIIEPQSEHYYQPGWTLVGSGLGTAADYVRPTSQVVPEFADWIQQRVAEFRPRENLLVLGDGAKVRYDWLVVAAGMKILWDGITGLPEALDTPYVSSIYSHSQAQKTAEMIKNFRGGTALFTQQGGPTKCGGAPQKVMWATEELFRKAGIRDQCEITFATGLPKIFGIPKYATTLEGLARMRSVNVLTNKRLLAINADAQEARFLDLNTGDRDALGFDILHVTPPMGPQPFLEKSPLAEKGSGWVEVDPQTLQHVRYPNVYALGDCANLPTSRTMAGIAAQYPVLVHNMLQAMEGREQNAAYNGYTCCPILVGRSKVMLAEYKYGGEPAESLGMVWDQANPTELFYLIKKYLFPWVYWNHFLKGTWYGPNLFFRPRWPPGRQLTTSTLGAE